MQHINAMGILTGRKYLKMMRTGIIWAVRELGVTVVSIACRLDQSVTSVVKAVIRGDKLATAKKYSLFDK